MIPNCNTEIPFWGKLCLTICWCIQTITKLIKVLDFQTNWKLNFDRVIQIVWNWSNFSMYQLKFLKFKLLCFISYDVSNPCLRVILTLWNRYFQWQLICMAIAHWRSKQWRWVTPVSTCAKWRTPLAGRRLRRRWRCWCRRHGGRNRRPKSVSRPTVNGVSPSTALPVERPRLTYCGVVKASLPKNSVMFQNVFVRLG